MNPLRSILIGTGSISHTHASAIKAVPELLLTACYNRTETRGEEFANKYNLQFYPSIEHMLDREKPDLVINTLGQRYHHIGLEAAASRGCHLVVEKPFACTLNECRKIMEIATEHNRILAVCESSAFAGLNLAVTAGRATWGKTLHLYETNFRHYFSSSRGSWFFDPHDGFGGMLLNVGVHRIAKMRILAGAPELSVTAVTGRQESIAPVEGDCSVLIRYANGACGVLQMCGYFPTGTVISNISRMITANGYLDLGNKPMFISATGEEIPVVPDIDCDAAEYVNFYRALAKSINENGPSPYSGEQAIRDVAVILAAMQSTQEKREVNIDEFIAQ